MPLSLRVNGGESVPEVYPKPTLSFAFVAAISYEPRPRQWFPTTSTQWPRIMHSFHGYSRAGEPL